MSHCLGSSAGIEKLFQSQWLEKVSGTLLPQLFKSL